MRDIFRRSNLSLDRLSQRSNLSLEQLNIRVHEGARKCGRWAAFNPHHYEEAKDARGFFEDFLKLERSPQSWPEFRKKFGLLNACRHLEPVDECPSEECRVAPDWPRWDASALLSEHRDWVVALARGFSACLSIRDALQSRKLSEAEHWEKLSDAFRAYPRYAFTEQQFHHPFLFYFTDHAEKLEAAREHLTLLVSWLLEKSGVSLAYRWTGTAPSLNLVDGRFRSVWPALVVEFAFRMADNFSYVCSGCGSFESFNTIESDKRKPRTDRRRFCDECKQRGVPARLRKRDERERKKTRPVAQAG